MYKSEQIMTKLCEKYHQVFLMDLSWHLYRSYYAYKNFSVSIDGYQRPTGHFYGVTTAIKSIKHEYPKALIVMCQDGVPVERQEMSDPNAGYKEGRPELEFDFYRDVEMLKAITLIHPDVFWAFNSDKESDDIMYALAKQTEKHVKDLVFIFSGDNDLLQSISDRIVITRKKLSEGYELITENSLQLDENLMKKFHGVDVKHIVFYRALVGDSSDNIKGISRIPRQIAVSMAMGCDEISDIRNFIPITKTEQKWKNIVLEEYEVVERNYNMMKLSSEIEVNITKPKPVIENVKKIIEDLQLNSWRNYLIREGQL